MDSVALTVFNYVFYLIQAIAFVTFSSKLLNSKFNVTTNFYISIVPVGLLFASSIMFNNMQYTLGYVEIIGFLFVMWIYTCSLFKNSFLLRLLTPVFSYILYTAVVLFYYFFASVVLNVDWYNLMINDQVYSIVAKLIINLTFWFALYIVYKFCNYRISLNSFSEYIFYVILPVITFGIIFLSFIIATDRKTSNSAMISLGVISIAMVFVSVLVMSLMLKAAYSNRVESQNYIMKKQQEQYRERIIEANKSLEEIAVIRHDMKNKILCIGELLNNANYEEAIEMCSEVKYELEKATVLFHTDNPYLNSILNITYKKAKENNIDIKVTASCNFKGVGSTDIVALIGNVCDNAIEYLTSIEGKRKLELKLTKKGSYYFISAKNNIIGSVLSDNPNLKSSKKDKIFHGHGIKNIRTIAKKYKGSVDISEIDSSFVINIMLEIPKKQTNKGR